MPPVDGTILQATMAVVVVLSAHHASRGWVDPVIGLAVAAEAVWEGVELWRGDGCQC